MGSIIVVNAWRAFSLPFRCWAGLQTISDELYEAAAIDGATAVQRFRHITVPMIKPVLLVVLLFSIIWTFADFQLVYVLTAVARPTARISLPPWPIRWVWCRASLVKGRRCP